MVDGVGTNPMQAGGMNAAQAIDGAMFVMAAGVMGQAFSPLGAGPLAQGMLPSMLQVLVGTLLGGGSGQLPTGGAFPLPADVKPADSITVKTTGQNTADIDLGDGYKLSVDERSSQLVITDTNTGQTTKIWGDPHVDVNGKHQFDFWGTSTFVLGNGTKITINTEQWAGNPNMYVAKDVTITKGDNAVVINGLSQNQLGDLSITTSHNGQALDAATRDGFTVHEGKDGWTTELGSTVTQGDADQTRPGNLYGPGSQAPSLGEIGQQASTFLLFGFAAQLGGLMGAALGTQGDAPARQAEPRNHAQAFRPFLLA